ncbi:MAG: hypothetical protein O3A47_01835 [Chloroflexi bacterium]|nr:hypothetical protein [Chloroflexota bacterium]
MNNHGSKRDSRLGEIVEASTGEFSVQCYELYKAPPLGALVRCNEDGPVYGVVSDVITSSLDPARHPIARGRDEDSEEAVYLSNPQLSRLLHTEFRALVVGHESDGRVLRYLAPRPPRIHSFVYSCSGDEVRTFSSSLDFVPILLSAPVRSPDDVATSFIRQASVHHPEPERFLVDAGRVLAGLLGRDMQRLNGLLKRLSP